MNLPQIRQMKYTVARGGMRLLGRAVHSLAKIGDDIYIEPQADSLTFRAVNSSRYVQLYMIDRSPNFSFQVSLCHLQF